MEHAEGDGGAATPRRNSRGRSTARPGEGEAVMMTRDRDAREQVHLRDRYGKFSTKRSSSEKATQKHSRMPYDDAMSKAKFGKPFRRSSADARSSHNQPSEDLPQHGNTTRQMPPSLGAPSPPLSVQALSVISGTTMSVDTSQWTDTTTSASSVGDVIAAGNLTDSHQGILKRVGIGEHYVKVVKRGGIPKAVGWHAADPTESDSTAKSGSELSSDFISDSGPIGVQDGGVTSTLPMKSLTTTLGGTLDGTRHESPKYSPALVEQSPPGAPKIIRTPASVNNMIQL